MIRILAFTAGMIAVFVSPSLVSAADSGNSCVDCHRLLPSKIPREHGFHDWETSIHSRVGVTCERCHGGNSKERDAQKAHEGVFPADDPRSSVNYVRIPETCGACHSVEFKAFTRSKHYNVLLKSGMGPNCATCHGAMANRVLSPAQVEYTCALCHRKSPRAAEALTALDQASDALRNLDKAIAEARGRKIDVSKQEQQYREASDREAEVLSDWHQFKMKEVLNGAHDITWAAAGAINELRNPKPQKTQRGQ